MKFRVQVVCVQDDGSERCCDVMELERQQLVRETLGLSMAEGKAILHGVQEFVTAQQAAEDLQRRRQCSHCGERYQSEEAGMHPVNTVFGPVAVPHSRWHRCACQTEGPKTLPAYSGLAERADQPGVAVSGNQVGFVDSFREGGRSIERSIAGRRLHQFTRPSANICRGSPSGWRQNWAKNGSAILSNRGKRKRNSRCRMAPSPWGWMAATCERRTRRAGLR